MNEKYAFNVSYILLFLLKLDTITANNIYYAVQSYIEGFSNGGNNLTVITLNALTTAIQKRINIDKKTANMYATIVINFFGYEDRIIDNLLTPQERRLFYLLEQHGILSSKREELTLPTGNPWRIHYWQLEKQIIYKYSQKNTPTSECYESDEPSLTGGCGDIYSSVTKDMWSQRKIVHG